MSAFAGRSVSDETCDYHGEITPRSVYGDVASDRWIAVTEVDHSV